MDWFERIRTSKCLDAVVSNLDGAPKKTPIALVGAAGSSTSIVVAAIASRSRAPILLVTAHRDDADETVAEIAGIAVNGTNISCALFPALESSFAGQEVAEQFSERVSVLRRIDGRDPPMVIVAPVTALMQGVPAVADMHAAISTIRRGDRLARESLLVCNFSIP